MGSLPVISVTWQGRHYECRPTMRCVMLIENEVPLQRLARVIMTTPQDIPISHICWVVYCLLKTAGAPVEPDDVFEAMKNGELPDDTSADIMRFVMAEVFGTGPEKPAPVSGGSKKKPVKRH